MKGHTSNLMSVLFCEAAFIDANVHEVPRN